MWSSNERRQGILVWCFLPLTAAACHVSLTGSILVMGAARGEPCARRCSKDSVIQAVGVRVSAGSGFARRIWICRGKDKTRDLIPAYLVSLWATTEKMNDDDWGHAIQVQPARCGSGKRECPAVRGKSGAVLAGKTLGLSGP